MTPNEAPAQAVEPADLPYAAPTRAPAPARRPRVWPAVLLVGLYWAYVFVSERIELPTFTRFLSQMAALLVVGLGFIIWWLASRGLRFSQRLMVLGVAILGGVAAVLLAHHSLGPITLLKGIPWMFTAWALWLVAARWLSARTRFAGAIVVLLLAWGVWPMLRMEGLTGTGDPALHWRWSKSAEDAYLAQHGAAAGPRGSLSPSTRPQGATGTLVAAPGDWTGFRGPNRDATVHGVTIATDWNANPPKLLWRQRVGPAWSSVAVVGNRVFTQEQRGETEAVVCRDADSGSELWSHEDPVRFSDILSGPGPRATPTFADGRLYTFSAGGTLNCLDAATGQRIWSHDSAAEAGAKVPAWGFASSPLVTHGVAIVFAGGEGPKGLRAYRADTGDPAWTAAAGRDSYSSPQLATVGGEEQVLFLSDGGLTAFDAATGSPRWEFANINRAPRSLQPLAVAPDQFLISLGMELETARVEVSRNAAGFAAAQRWASRQLKPSFNDSVLYNGNVYGFDGPTFCCIDAQTGARRWKHGRYGTGQVLLLADQPLLVVLTDTGEVVLVAASPDSHQELARFQPINGKTWNHPAIAHNRLYVRNSEEMACFELTPAKSR
jgi:outer membrane protein assembly factor BamB